MKNTRKKNITVDLLNFTSNKNINLIGKISDNWIRSLGFNHSIHQILIGILIGGKNGGKFINKL